VQGYARSRDLEIAYEVHGQGPGALLLIVGLGGRSADWGTPFIQGLARGRRVITFDNRGTGASSKPDGWWSLEDMASDALAVLDELGVERADVLGHSMGGMIAELCALDHPARVRRLVLVSTHFGGPEVVQPAPEIAEILRPARGTPVDAIVREAMRRITAPGFAERDPEAIERLVELAVRQPTPKAAFSAQLAALLSSDRSQRVSAIRCPTLVVHGDCDPLIPAENGIRLAERIGGARLELLEGVGHVPTWESCSALVELVNGFLSPGSEP
jgi:pimeloyl-ACP methyl ester carboxylesterase